jgi:hypothetical protein
MIRVGDVVRVVSLERPRVGDVILRELAGRWVVHRVRRVKPAVVTRGDASPVFDPPAGPESLHGRVEAIKWSGRWIHTPDFPTGLVVAAVSISAAALYSRVRRWLAAEKPQ